MDLSYASESLQEIKEGFLEVRFATVLQLSDDGVIFVEDGNHGEYRPRRNEFVERGIPFVRPPDLVNGRINFDNCDHINDVAFQRVRKGIGKGGDIVLTHRATVGRLALTTESDTVFVTNPGTTIWRSTNPAILNQKYIYWYMHSRAFMDQVDEQSGQTSTFPYISLTQQRGLIIPVLPIDEQEAIAAVLSSLDDKIDLLHRQNKTLEALAQTLFRHWFIENAADEWEDGCLGDISNNIRNGIRHDKIPNGTIYIGLKHIDKKNISLNRNGLSDDVNSNKYQFEENDILFGKLRPYFHKVCFSPFSGVCSTDILVLRPRRPHYFCFSLFTFFQNDVVEYANLGSGGTRMPRTNWNTLREYPVQIPPENIIKQFDELIYPFIVKITQNLLQSRTLEELRDTLLPKLMSGDIRVRLKAPA